MVLKIQFILVFIFSLLYNSSKGQISFKAIEALYTNGHQDSAINTLKQNISLLTGKQNENVNLSRSFNLLGELYLKQNEFEEAYVAWDKSRAIIESNYGIESVYMAEVYSEFSRYYSFLIKRDSSYWYAKKSIDLLNKRNLSEIPLHKIYRQYSFSSKIYIETEDNHKSRIIARHLLDSALFYNKKSNKNDEAFCAQIYADLGNTYTDEVLFYQLEGDKLNSDRCLKKANEYYDLALKTNLKIYGQKSYPVALNYFLKSLAYNYNDQSNPNAQVLICQQKALSAITINFTEPSPNSYPVATSQFINPVFALQLFRFKIDSYNAIYENQKDTSSLGLAYRHSKEAIKLWNTIFSSLKSNDIHLALETYSNSPLFGAIETGIKYQEITKDRSIERELIEWMDLVKYESILKLQLSNNILTLETPTFTIERVQKKLKSNEAILEYCTFKNKLYAFVITKTKYQLYNKPVNLKHVDVDLLNFYLFTHNSTKFCAAAKSMYDSIVNPYIKDLPKSINHLVIVPHDKMSLIPFNALVVNDSRNYKNADFLIKHYALSQALSLRLWVNNSEEYLKRNLSYLAPSNQNLTALPFNQKLIEALNGKMKIKEFELKDSVTKNEIFHFSGHTFYDAENSRNSSLVFRDSLWSLDKISKLKLGFRLAVISACETAKGKQEIGEGTINFSRNFYLAGVKSTITTLWKVDDQSTAKILTEFYNAILAGQSTVMAIHNAQLNYLNTVESVDDYDPYYWAGLVYTGTDLNIAPDENKSIVLGFSLFTLFVFAGLFLIRKFLF